MHKSAFVIGFTLLVVACGGTVSSETTSESSAALNDAPPRDSERTAICKNKCGQQWEQCYLGCPLKGYDRCISNCNTSANECFAGCIVYYPQ